MIYCHHVEIFTLLLLDKTGIQRSVNSAKFEVFTAMKIGVAVFWVVTSCSAELYYILLSKAIKCESVLIMYLLLRPLPNSMQENPPGKLITSSLVKKFPVFCFSPCS
jgi:hypothetical protein